MCTVDLPAWSSDGLSLNNNFEFQILKQLSDPEGRFVIADVKTEGKFLTLANIYAPNDNNPTFFKNVLNQLISFDCGEIVLGGDYNLVLELEKDRIGGNPTTHKKSLKEVLYIPNLLDLLDIWRIFNPDAVKESHILGCTQRNNYYNKRKYLIQFLCFRLDFCWSIKYVSWVYKCTQDPFLNSG